MSIVEWKTLYDSLKGKKFSTSHASVLKKALDKRQQSAVMGLILYHASIDEDTIVERDQLPYGIKEVEEGVQMEAEEIPVEVMVKINQMLSK